mmetsp:Transcript_68732/g.222064  ORF Transcript_68732/g.222064 Transcript_68732/m.222064 type:complete len:363 (-) Transcript_68732:1510-2598(-)
MRLAFAPGFHRRAQGRAGAAGHDARAEQALLGPWLVQPGLKCGRWLRPCQWPAVFVPLHRPHNLLCRVPCNTQGVHARRSAQVADWLPQKLRYDAHVPRRAGVGGWCLHGCRASFHDEACLRSRALVVHPALALCGQRLPGAYARGLHDRRVPQRSGNGWHSQDLCPRPQRELRRLLCALHRLGSLCGLRPLPLDTFRLRAGQARVQGSSEAIIADLRHSDPGEQLLRGGRLDLHALLPRPQPMGVPGALRRGAQRLRLRGPLEPDIHALHGRGLPPALRQRGQPLLQAAPGHLGALPGAPELLEALGQAHHQQATDAGPAAAGLRVHGALHCHVEQVSAVLRHTTPGQPPGHLGARGLGAV